MSKTCKSFLKPKIAKKWLSIGTPPNFFYQNDSEWPEMDFKHNFENREIFYFWPPPTVKNFTDFFFKASLKREVFKKKIWQMGGGESRVCHTK